MMRTECDFCETKQKSCDLRWTCRDCQRRRGVGLPLEVWRDQEVATIPGWPYAALGVTLMLALAALVAFLLP